MFMTILGTVEPASQGTQDTQVTIAWIGVVTAAVAGFFAWLSARRSKEAREGNTAEHGQVVGKVDVLIEKVDEHNRHNGERFGALESHLSAIDEKFGRHLEWHLNRKEPDHER